jgi:hypothetical protein
MYDNNKVEIRIYVKIVFSESGQQAPQKCVYYRNEMTIDFFHRWKWYFKYREALLRVKHPRSYIELYHGPYEYELPENIYREKIKNQYLSDKRQLTKFTNKLNQVIKHWNQLFPIEEDPHWSKVNDKMNYYKKRLELSEKEYKSVFNN